MGFTTVDSRRLVDSHCAGDPAAFPAIVKAHYPALLVRARQRLHDHQAAEDAVQEALLRAYRGLPRFGDQGDWHLSAWLYRILDNVCIDEANRRRRNSELVARLSCHAADVEPAAEASAALPDPQLSAAVRSLPDAYREALLQREVEGLSYAEMAASAGISEENARARVSRARNALRRVIGPAVAVVAWVVAFARRGERVLTDGSSSSVASASATVSVSLPASSAQLITQVSQVTAVASEQQFSAAIKVAAAVAAVALPVGGVTGAVVQQRQQQQRLAAPAEQTSVQTIEEPGAPVVVVAASSPLVVTDAELHAAAETATTLAAADETTTTSAQPTTTTTVAGATDTTTTTEPADTTTTAPIAEEPTAGTGDTVGDGAGESPDDDREYPSADGSTLVLTPTVTVARLDDGRYQLTGEVGVETDDGPVTGRLELLTDVPARTGDTGEYRFGGSILFSDGARIKIRLSGLVVETTEEGKPRTFSVTGKYASSDASKLGIASKGDFDVRFGLDERQTLSLRLAPSGSTAS